jgi:predicted dehydrogenase
METVNETTRRGFLKTAGVTAAGIAGATVAKSSVYAVAPPRAIGANDRITIGFIGCGGMGGGHIANFRSLAQQRNTQILAVCDPYLPRQESARQATGLPASAANKDYRRMLEMKDLDSVLIASPEHWHARQAIDAIAAGKHVYLQKPMTRHLEEAVALYRAVKASKSVVQVGSQAASDAKWHVAGKAVREGRIGNVVWGQGGYCRNVPDGEWNYGIDEGASPENLDWAMWLGPAPKVPFSKERYFRWRKYWDYSTGILSDLLPHVLHPLMIATGGGEYPARVTCTGTRKISLDRECPDTTHFLAEFPSGLTLMLAGSTVNEQNPEFMIRGEKANIYFGGAGVEIRPERPFSDEVEQERLPVNGPGEDHIVHENDWLTCIRTGKVPNCNIDLATKTQVTLSLAELSFTKGQTMGWDPVKMVAIPGSGHAPLQAQLGKG